VKTFGQRIREIRNTKGESIWVASLTMGWNGASLGNVEKGKHSVTSVRLLELLQWAGEEHADELARLWLQADQVRIVPEHLSPVAVTHLVKSLCEKASKRAKGGGS
jgi:hypothetical protein